MDPAEEDEPIADDFDNDGRNFGNDEDKVGLVKKDEADLEKSWLALFSFTQKPHAPYLAAALFFSLVSGLVIPGMSILLGKIFGAFASFGSGDYNSEKLLHEVSKYVIALTVLGTVSWIFNAIFFSAWLMFGELQAQAAREHLFEGLLDKDMEWYDSRKSGVAGLISRCQTQVKELQMALSQPIGYSIQAIITALASLGVALYHSWSLTLVILAGVPVAISALAFLSNKLQPRIDIQKDHLAEASKTANGAITAIETVKAFNGQQDECDRFSRAIELAAKAYRSQAKISALQIGFIRFITLAMFVQGFWYGSHLVRKGGEKTAGDVMTCFWSCLMATQSFEMILPQMLLMEKGRAAGGSLKTLLVKIERGRELIEMHGGLIPDLCEGEIEIKNASFSYPSRPGQLALDSVSFFIPARETTFVIGRSGSGKSTLGNLILKGYEPFAGTITLDGNPLKVIDSKWLRENITLVQQTSVLFNETIFRNIALAKKDYEKVTRDEVKGACRMALLEETLFELPMGYETICGVGGKQLSGGQRQRVALARAILRDTPVLILDEATSALDYVSRSLVMDAIHEWRKGKTTIIITHDISQIRSNDFVYILDKGKIVRDGYRCDLEGKTGAFQSFMKVSESNKSEGKMNLKLRKQSLIPELDSDYTSDEEDTDTLPEPSPSGLNFSYTMDSIKVQPPEIPNQTPRERRRSKIVSKIFGKSLQEMYDLPLSPLTCAPNPGGMELVELSGNATLENRRANMRTWRSRKTSLRIEAGPSGGVIEHSKKRRRFLKRVRRAKPPDDSSLLRIFSTIWPSLDFWGRFTLVFGFVAALLHAAATPVFSYALAQLLGSFFDLTTPESVSTKWSLVVLGIAIADALNSYLMHYLLESSGQAWVDRLRKESLSRILEQPRSWFDRERNAVSRIIEDIEKNAEEMRNLVGRFAGYAFVGFIMSFMGITWSFAESWQLTLVGISIAPVMYAITRGFTLVSDKWEGLCNEAAETTGVIFEETITNIRTVRALSLEKFFRKKYLGATSAAINLGKKRSIYAGIGFGLADSVILFVTALIFYYGAVLTARDLYDLGDILTVFTLLLFSLGNANAIVGLIPQISNSKDTAIRVLRLAHLPRNSHERSGQEQHDYNGAIKFQNVRFAYPSRPDTLVLRNFNLEIKAGECVAIVGFSGSGKSTIVALLQRFYPISGGSLTIDTRPISLLDTSCLRSQMAIVPQSPILFDSSVYENITYGMPRGTFTRHDVESSATQAGIHDFVANLPNGYATRLGENGATVSGGQAQRIVIARALLRKPKILILDECTSNLDCESASVVHETIGRLLKRNPTTVTAGLAIATQGGGGGGGGGGGMTVVVITHAREMMKCADRVIVMSSGEVVESGGFETLLKAKGELARLLSRGEWVGSRSASEAD